VRVRQSWVEGEQPMKRRSLLCGGCCNDNGSVSDGAEEAQQLGEAEMGGRSAPESSSLHRQSDDDGVDSRFLRIAPDNPWLVCRSVDHGGKLFWMHEQTRETTWRQPLPRLAPLPELDRVDPRMREWCFQVVDARFFGAPADVHNPKARTGICGVAPQPGPLHRTLQTLSAEHCMYPRQFLEAVGVHRYVLCEELRYNGQRRRDVPDLASGTLYIDVGDRAARRKR
jgi:hypothetical protein